MAPDMIPEMGKGDALVIIDVQRDFCSGGALEVPGGDQVVPVLNRWIEAAEAAGVPIYASRDWHPRAHVSFRESGGDWPPHCVQDTPGAAFHPALHLPESVRVVCKGVRLDKDQVSLFEDTGLAEDLRRQEIRRLWIGGLAQDVCVRLSVVDAARAGFDVHVIRDGTRPVKPAAEAAAFDEMRAAGASVEP